MSSDDKGWSRRGPGVSKAQLPNGRWRVRWYETVRDEATGEESRRQREKVVSDKASATVLESKILQALERAELPNVDPVRSVPAVASLDAVFLGWLEGKKAAKKSAGSLDAWGKRIKRIMEAIRDVKNIAADVAVPADVLERPLLVALVNGWSTLADGTVYDTVGTLFDAWSWALLDPKTYPGVPPVMRAKDGKIGPSALDLEPPIYEAPDAPTVAEVDAMLRHLRSPWSFVATGASILMRYSGLRISQALAVQRDDFNAVAMTLRVRVGKGKRETAAQRTIPLAPSFLEDFAPYMNPEEDPSAPLIRRRRDVRAAANKNHHPTAALTRAWKTATERGECREGVWKPKNRKNARPDHAFRAFVQQHLEDAGVRAPVIDVLVGHAPSKVRGRHYTRPTDEQLRTAVSLIPPIDWGQTEPKARKRSGDADNVVPMRARS